MPTISISEIFYGVNTKDLVTQEWLPSSGLYPTDTTEGIIHIAQDAGTVSGTEYAIGDSVHYVNGSWLRFNSSAQALSGTNYDVVFGTGTAAENATELQTKYTTAKAIVGLSASNRYTIMVGPGYYEFSSDFDVDTPFIDIVSLSGNRDVKLTFTNPLFSIMVMSDNVILKGIDVGLSPFIIADDLDNLRVENCKGGDLSFGSDCIASGTFINCEGGAGSFGGTQTGYGGQATGTFIGCIGGANSFGYLDGSGGQGYDMDLGQFVTAAAGTFERCTAGVGSFGAGGTASGIFDRCVAGGSSFGFYGSLTGKLYYCTTQGTFITPTGGGEIFYSIDSTGLVGGGSSGGASGVVIKDNTFITGSFQASSNTWYTNIDGFTATITPPTSPSNGDEIWFTVNSPYVIVFAGGFTGITSKVGTVLKLKYMTSQWVKIAEEPFGTSIYTGSDTIINSNFTAEAGNVYWVSDNLGKFAVVVSPPSAVHGDEITIVSTSFSYAPDISLFGLSMTSGQTVRLKYFYTPSFNGWMII